MPQEQPEAVRSGYGFELSFRLAIKEDVGDVIANAKAPVWPRNLMQNLARYVFSTGILFLLFLILIH